MSSSSSNNNKNYSDTYNKNMGYTVKYGQNNYDPDKSCPTFPLTIPEQAANLRTRIINNKKILGIISDVVAKKLNKKELTMEEIGYLIKTIRQLDYNKFVQLSFPNVIDYISSLISNDIKHYKCDSGPSYDIKKMYDLYSVKKSQYDIIKKNVQVTGVKPTGISGEYYQRQILEFDSRYKIRNNGPISEFQFAVQSTGGQDLGVVKTLDEIVNIRSMKIYPFSIPYNTQADSQFRRLKLVIKELPQTIKSWNGTDFHFLFETTVNGNRIDLNPIIDTYTFPKVIYQLTDATLTFRNQNVEVVFDPTELITGTFADLGASVFEITSTIPHNLSTGDLVNFQDFKFGGTNTIQDDVLTRTQGHFVTVTGPNTFTVNVDMSASLPVDDGWLIILTSKQFIAHIEFTYVRSHMEGRIATDETNNT